MYIYIDIFKIYIYIHINKIHRYIYIYSTCQEYFIGMIFFWDLQENIVCSLYASHAIFFTSSSAASNFLSNFSQCYKLKRNLNTCRILWCPKKFCCQHHEHWVTMSEGQFVSFGSRKVVAKVPKGYLGMISDDSNLLYISFLKGSESIRTSGTSDFGK